MYYELNDYEFDLSGKELFDLLNAFEHELKRSADETWPVVVAGIALEHGFSHRGFIRDA